MTTTTTLICCLLVSAPSAMTPQSAMTVDELRTALAEASEEGLTREQATRFTNLCLKALRQSRADIDQSIDMVKTLGKVYKLAPLEAAESIRQSALDELANLAAHSMPVLSQLTWFTPRRFGETERERAAQFRDFDNVVDKIAGNKGDDETNATKCYLQAYIRISASRRRSGFTSTERQSTEKILRHLASEFGALEGPLGLTYEEYVKSAVFELQNLAVGTTVPNIQTTDLDGNPFDLADYRGRVVVLSFWATWCPPCVAEIPFEKKNRGAIP